MPKNKDNKEETVAKMLVQLKKNPVAFEKALAMTLNNVREQAQLTGCKTGIVIGLILFALGELIIRGIISII